MSPGLRKLLTQLAIGACDWPLYIWGSTGRGKTCAAIALANMTADSLYVGCEKLCEEVYNEHIWWQRLAECNLAIIDELGLRPAQDQRAYLAIKRAADLREHKQTIWISNHGPEALKRLFDDRIYSRLVCGTSIQLTGNDRRVETP